MNKTKVEIPTWMVSTGNVVFWLAMYVAAAYALVWISELLF